MSLCIINVVNSRYQKYIPMFLLFCSNTYPQYSTRILLTGSLHDKYKNIISRLKKLTDIKILENYFQKNYEGHELKSLRWLIDYEKFSKWDNLYIGDIDILLCKERISLEMQHLNHCYETKLPYSNSVRPNSKRLSGLHFIRRDIYNKQMKSILELYRNQHTKGLLRDSKNEEILYSMVKEAGLTFPEGWFRPHHGLHLRVWLKERQEKLPDKFYDEDQYCEHFKYFLKVEKTELYQEIFQLTPLIEIINMKQHLKKFCRII